jgi:hypothetical protein
VDVRGALSKHRQMLGSRYVELFPSAREEVDQLAMIGTIMM